MPEFFLKNCPVICQQRQKLYLSSETRGVLLFAAASHQHGVVVRAIGLEQVFLVVPAHLKLVFKMFQNVNITRRGPVVSLLLSSKRTSMNRNKNAFHHFNGGLNGFGGNSGQKNLDSGSGERRELRKLKQNSQPV